MQRVILYMLGGLAIGYMLSGCAAYNGAYSAADRAAFWAQHQVIRDRHNVNRHHNRRNHHVPNATLPNFGGQQMRHGMSAGH